MSDVQLVDEYTNEGFTRHYAFIHEDEAPDFWNNVYQGAYDTGIKNGVYVEDFGDNLTVDYDRNTLVRIAIDAHVDGIILDGGADEQTIELINTASSAGIPVVTVLDDSVGSNRISFVGINSYSMGRQYAEQLVKELDPSIVSDIYVMMDSGRSDSGQELVISGISDALNESGYEGMYTIEGVYVSNEATFSAEEEIRDIFLKDKLPNAIVSLSSVYTRCLFQAEVDLNMVGQVYLYGFHDSDDILEAVRKNIVEATISVDTSQMGASTVEALEEYFETGYVSDYFDQDTQMILADGAEEILSSQNEETE